MIKYFESRIKNEGVKKEPGPVITISREYGCPSKVLAGIVADKLNQLDHGSREEPHTWRWIGRELLEEAAKDLKVDPKHINHIFDYHERSLIDDILAATRKDGTYKSDHLIKKSISKVIRTLGERGHIIVVGRAAVVINRDIPKSLHIRLMAPIEWRVDRIMETQGLTREQAIETMNAKDANRKRFLEYYLGHKFKIQIWDAIYNCGYLSLEEIADSVVNLARLKKLY